MGFPVVLGLELSLWPMGEMWKGKDKGSGIYDMLKVQILTVNPQGQFLFWIICGQSGLTAWPVEH